MAGGGKRLTLFLSFTLVVGGVAFVPRLLAGPADDRVATTAGGPAVTVRAVDEAGRPLGEQIVSLGNGPAMAVAQAPGHIAEPVLLGLEDAGKTVDVRLLSDDGGKRFVVNSAGDVMFGRRFQSGGDSGPQIPAGDAAAGARAVVNAVAPAFRMADLSTVNLETVVSSAAPSAAYPKKRFILESPPASVDALLALGVTVPLLANNHTRDFLDSGVADTSKALADAGLPVVGTAVGDEPEKPFQTTVHGTGVAVLGYTSVDGSYVNDSYPKTGAPTGDDDAWQYQPRTWGYGKIPTADRTIGQAWAAYERLSRAEQAAAWQSLTRTYPEIQDWVARRGHAGAARWDNRATPAQIHTVAAQSRLTIVELHSGFQFQTASAEETREMARAAIDAGAGIVICHHPHVLQGFEWYKGHLIAYSLGNFVFDQDFLSTFSSAYLRTVWDGDRLVEARLVPVEIDGYRPELATGQAARRTVNGVREDSQRSAQTIRAANGAVLTVPITRDPDTKPARFHAEHGTALITADPSKPTPVTVAVGPHTDTRIGFDGLIDPRQSNPDISVGRDLFGWGSFEDQTVDGRLAGDTHWGTAVADITDGYLHIGSAGGQEKLDRPVARIALPRHREEAADGTPLDPEPTYTIKAKVRTTGNATALFRLTPYHFDDSDPTEDPQSTPLRDVDKSTVVPSDGQWHEVSFDVQLGADGNMVLPHLGIAAGRAGSVAEQSVDFDDVSFVEWRPAAGVPDEPGAYDFVRNAGAQPVALSFTGYAS
ncbi:CapA family protein [Kutzneria buriramensis]|uniref:Poly-gamma-glutamate capsule biosynthesis protein CapA/YwtB (Metallophosphatase superfamily) n=1 Tax=Kutzneria buriramensis TaxID=1045776 RepID=A0A3E0IAB8_9PSEU|nr:CapA family protein [Kutzneria buriramensis]REH55095.1 poly-gamma-glutamate capsule biosynthesis protein CapA/YwtB (metallophosphatase superfamily) [Kutzneria buriramensis]